MGVPAKLISNALICACAEYERMPADLNAILAFYVAIERIHPFHDYNGRVGRIIMVKECLRYGVDPFVIDDKHRSAYFRGVSQWDKNPEILRGIAERAQGRFRNKVDTCRLMKYHKPPTQH